jgi:hypothetical protein
VVGLAVAIGLALPASGAAKARPSKKDHAMKPAPPAAPAVQLYPRPHAARSEHFQVSANGQPVFAESYRDVTYARFAMAGRVPVEIQTDDQVGPVGKARVAPASAVADLAIQGHRVRFTLVRPANVAVTLESGEKLFVLADPIETAPPVPGQGGAVSVLDYGADATGKALATAPLQKALDEAAARKGGGTVVVPEGIFLTGTLVLKSHVTLYLAPGALLRGSGDPADYPIDPGRHESGSDTSISSADQRYQGETMTFSRLILFDDAEGARILGRGTIDGNGSSLRQGRNAVPNVIRVRGGHDLAIRDVMIRDAAAWTVHILGAKKVVVENVKIINDRSNLNTDGVDPDSSQDVAIRNSLIYTKDDGVCIKATQNSGILADVERIEVTGNVVSSLDAALKVGTESRAAHFKDILFRDNDVFDSERAMSIVVRDGATYSNITFRDIRVAPGVKHLVEQVIGLRKGRQDVLGHIDHLTFEDIDAPKYDRPESNWTWYTQFRPGGANEENVVMFAGADAEHAVHGLRFKDVVVNGVRLKDRAEAEKVANLNIGPFVDDVTFE